MHNFIPMRAGENLIWQSNVEHSPFSHKIILTLLLSYNLKFILVTLQVFATGLAASWSTQSIGRSSVLPVWRIFWCSFDIWWPSKIHPSWKSLLCDDGFQLLRRHIFAGKIMGACAVLCLWEQDASSWNIVKWLHVLFVFVEADFQVDETQSNWCKRSCVAKKCTTKHTIHW